MGRYLDIARQFEKRMAAEKQETVSPQRQSPAWPCPHCGSPAEIEAVERSVDGQRLLTYWHCEPCQVWALTPDSLRQPPVWVSREVQ